ncbi:uncharacterized protein LOC121836158 [Ixodes scapularis]|uniref:uncharacterized protein LOC121836158 n=1 Tax=Ixodes scapularis TaxID=6945 RepID=UPI001C386337|nr:uncharacterized protein LOC121836158 [Ixodes scapularis]
MQCLKVWACFLSVDEYLRDDESPTPIRQSAEDCEYGLKSELEYVIQLTAGCATTNGERLKTPPPALLLYEVSRRTQARWDQLFEDAGCSEPQNSASSDQLAIIPILF